MGKIICIMGKSSTGKDTIYKKLLECKELSLKRIVPYTTRPIRATETEGAEYFFVTDEEYKKILKQKNVVESREYYTCHGIWRYFTVNDEHIDLKNSNYIIIGTLDSYIQMSKYFEKDVVIPFLIELDDGVRLQRALDREKEQENPKYSEMCRRFLADQEDFSEEKIQNADVKYRYQNNNLEECFQEMKEGISGIISN